MGGQTGQPRQPISKEAAQRCGVLLLQAGGAPHLLRLQPPSPFMPPPRFCFPPHAPSPLPPNPTHALLPCLPWLWPCCAPPSHPPTHPLTLPPTHPTPPSHPPTFVSGVPQSLSALNSRKNWFSWPRSKSFLELQVQAQVQAGEGGGLGVAAGDPIYMGQAPAISKVGRHGQPSPQPHSSRLWGFIGTAACRAPCQTPALPLTWAMQRPAWVCLQAGGLRGADMDAKLHTGDACGVYV